jgi:hypothetical protein
VAANTGDDEPAVAHYSVVVAVENRRLVAWATRDFRHPVPAAALVIAAGDEVLWFCDSGQLQLVFEASPFQSGIREITVPRGRSSPPEIGAGRAGRQRDVFKYAIRFEIGADRPAESVAHIIVEATSVGVADSHDTRQEKRGAGLVRPQESILNTREGEVLDRAQGEVPMVKHKLKIKKVSAGSKVEYDYEKDGSSVDVSHAIPYLIVKPKDQLEFEAPADGAVIIAFGGDGTPFADGVSVVFLGKGKTTPKLIREPEEKKIIAYKYTAVLVKDIDSNIFIDDPHVIIDNEG